MEHTADTRWQPGDLVFFLAVLVPVLQWLPLKDGTEHYVATYTAMTLWTITGLLVLAAGVALEDLWLGLLMAWFDLQILRYQTTEVYETALLLTLGAAALVSVRRFDERRRRIARVALIVSGAFQATVAILEGVWFSAADIPLSVWGTLGNSNFLGLYLAILAPLAPVGLLPLLLLGLLASTCLTGVVTVCVGLLVRFRLRAVPWLLAGAAVGAATLALKADPFAGLRARLDVWRLVLRHMDTTSWLMGHGPGRWKILAPFWQLQEGQGPATWFVQAHSDWLQLIFEGGLVALAFVLLWIWAHRAMFAGEYGGAAAAIAVGALGMFLFHLVTLGLLCLVVLGLATATSETKETAT